MRLVIQRVSRANLNVDGREVARIGPGAVVLVGVSRDDTDADIDFLARKTSQLRIYNDENGQLNAAIDAVDGAFLVVSQFTLYGDCKKGNRPSYGKAARPEEAEARYEQFAKALADLGHEVQTGVFRATMEVELVNDGPVTIIMESTGRGA